MDAIGITIPFSGIGGGRNVGSLSQEETEARSEKIDPAQFKRGLKQRLLACKTGVLQAALQA